ncbi:MAG: metallophosphoesterase [Candidatus Aminicenantes bacterium]|nr:metallophosphoesterase [Candidatus Aminicenantes bacterium]
MRILHISDTHIGVGSAFNSEAFEHVFKEVKDGVYDLVIHSGDITQGGRTQEFKKAREILSCTETPCIMLPGNHDARSGGLFLFEKYIGPLNGVREVGDAVIIYVNSAFEDSDQGRVGMVKFNMMRDALNKYGEKPIKILAIHHHIIPIPMAGRERNVLYNAGDILELILKEDLDLVLSGHRHYPNIYQIENTVFINAGTASATKTRYGDINSYNVIEIKDKERKVKTLRIDGKVQQYSFAKRKRRIFSDFGKREFRAIQVANTLISDSRPFLKRNFTNAMATIEELKPDLLVHCGGIVREGIAGDYDYALSLLSEFDFPILYTPAGRDINYLGYYLFPTYFGLIDQRFSNETILFQGISSAQYDSQEGIVGPSQRKALLEKLQSPEDIKAVFLHHNVLPIPHSREKGLLEDSGDLLRDLANARVDLILTGTSSHPFAAQVEDSIVVNANSLSSIYQRSVFGNSFNIIDIYEGAIAVFEVNSLWGRQRLLGIWERNKNTDHS